MTDRPMTRPRRCTGHARDGRPCGAPPQHDSEQCFWHDPSRAEDAAAARKLGGQRRRRERLVADTYDLDGLATIADIRRVLEIALAEALALDNSPVRIRLVTTIAAAATRLLDPGELEQRLAALEQASLARPPLRPVASLLREDDEDDSDERAVAVR
jgi:hypothetical protein